MTISQQEFESILADETKHIAGDITWADDVDHSPAREFRVGVQTNLGYSMSVVGRYNPFYGKLSYSFILQGTGRIYGLDLGVDHRNPGRKRELLRDKHKHSWRQKFRDKLAYSPEDITETWDRPVGVWSQFCAEANLAHHGAMYPPHIPQELSI